MESETRREIIFAGFGGQGVITAGFITGQATSVYDDKESVLTQVYGPEARGSACHSGVVIDENEIDYPYPINPEIMIVMSQDAYEKFLSNLKPGGILVIDSSTVETGEEAEKYKLYKVPSTEIAENMGARIIANVILLGFLAKIWDAVSVESMRKSVKSRVPESYLELNMKGFDKGVELASDKQKKGRGRLA